MAVWVCRAGKRGIYHSMFIDENRIFLAWEGLDKDLSLFDNYELMKDYVRVECDDQTQKAASTHANQVKIFTDKMKKGDYVITPASSSGDYSVGVIISDYRYDHNAQLFHHSREVCWIKHNLRRSIFSEKMQRTLGAYRTVFALKDDTEFIEYIKTISVEGA